MRLTLSLLFLALVAAGCAGNQHAEDTGVTAIVRDASGRELGTLELTQATDGIMLTGTLRGLTPGVHGIHLHTVGVCTPTFEAAGGHWNPTARAHGLESPQGSHLGDIPNITVDASGNVDIRATSAGGTLHGDRPLLDANGAALVVHAAADDNRTDPAGNSGLRVACGVVTGS